MKVRKAGGGQWGAVRRRVQKCGVAALHRHVRDELLQVIVGDVSWSAGSESQPCSSKAAVYEDSSCLVRKVAVVSDMYMCMCMCMHMHIVMCGRAPRGPTCCIVCAAYSSV